MPTLYSRHFSTAIRNAAHLNVIFAYIFLPPTKNHKFKIKNWRKNLRPQQWHTNTDTNPQQTHTFWKWKNSNLFDVCLFIYLFRLLFSLLHHFNSICLFFFQLQIEDFSSFSICCFIFFLCIVCIVLLLLLLLLLLLQQFTHSKTVFFFFVFIAVVKLKSKRRSVFFLWWFSTIPRRLHTHTNEFWFGLLLLLALLLRFVGVFISLNRAISVTHALHAIARAHFEFACNNGIERRNDDVCALHTLLFYYYYTLLCSYLCSYYTVSHTHILVLNWIVQACVMCLKMECVFEVNIGMAHAYTSNTVSALAE